MCLLSVHGYLRHRALHSFPTRRSSDLNRVAVHATRIAQHRNHLRESRGGGFVVARLSIENVLDIDRKSTRLNSSHRCISYAVFCLKKKKPANHTLLQDELQSRNAAVCM